MRKFLLTLLMVMGFAYSQTPIIRLMQSRTYKTPKFWWRDQVTQDLRTYLADDTSTPAYKNNNFDAWRDSVMTVTVTLDDNGASVTAFRLDLVFDNDLFTWDNTTITGHDSTRVEKGAYISGWTEGDNGENGHHYSYEVTWYNNVGYTDGIASAGNEKSASDNRYDWLRITMVSHNGNTHTFGNGDGNQTELLKLHFKVNDVADNFNARSFRVATEYENNTGYYTYVTNGNYASAYKVYIDGNYGTESTDLDGARGDITLHPKLLDVEGYFRYAQGNTRATGAAWNIPAENTYPYWKVKFELDKNEANFNPRITNWYNLEDIDNDANTADEDGSDDVIGDHTSTFRFNKKALNGNTASTGDATLPTEGFLGISYYDSTYTDDKGYYNIQLPRNNRYRISFWPPDGSDGIPGHTILELKRDDITTVADAIKSFNFQSGKHKNYNSGGTRIDTLTAIEYLIGDVDGDDKFFLNDTYILWSYVSGIMSNYTHHNGNSLEDWSTIDNFNGNNTSYTYYQTVNGQSRPQKYEFTVYWDETTIAEKSRLDRTNENPNYFVNNSAGWVDSLKAPMTVTKALVDAQKTLDVSGNFVGQIEILNPLMNDAQTGLDTLHLVLGAGYSEWHKDRLYERNNQKGNPDYLMPDIGYYFTGDINATGTKVTEGGGDGYQNDIASNIMYHRWKGASAPTHHLNKINTNNNVTLSEIKPDVYLSLPADSTVRVQSGNQIDVPLTIIPNDSVIVAGFEFEVEFDTRALKFIDMKTDVLPGPWMTYVNVHEPVNGWQKVSFGGIDYSPGNAPETYHITKEMIGLKLLFEAEFPEAEELYTAPIKFVGKSAASTPNGEDLLVHKSDGYVEVWNKYWAFGGSKPDDESITYNYPNPFKENTVFQFYLDESQDVKLYILNSMGQRIGTLLNEYVFEGLHTFDFTNEPSIWIPEMSIYEKHQKLEPGVYIFVLQTNKKLKANKFTVIK